MEKMNAVLIAVVVLAFSIVLVGALVSLTIHTSGNIKTPAALQATPPSIEWDTIYNGTSNYYLIGLTNTGDEPTLGLQMTTDPISLPYGVLEWNCTNEILDPDEWMHANFTLTIYPTATEQPFQFDIIIKEAQA